MDIAPYLHFDGNCSEAFAFYEKALGGKITMRMTFGESPAKDQTDPEWQNKVMHATLTGGKQVIMGSDVPPQHFSKPQGFAVSLTVSSYAEAERLFKAVSDQARSVSMPFQKTFWSEGFGMCVDRFGTSWMVGVAQA
jgi:PhnB protein